MSSPSPSKLGPNPAQAYINRRNKNMARKDGGGKQLKRRTRYSTVTCRIHGKIPSGTGYTLPELRCPIPRNKREQFGGCHMCAQDKAKGK